MMRRDYILWLIEDLGRFLARLAFLRQSGKHDQARLEIDTMLTATIGLTLDEITAAEVELLPPLLGTDGAIDLRNITAVAAVLAEAGHVLELKGREGEMLEARVRALYLYLYALGDGAYRGEFDIPMRIGHLLEHLGEVLLTAEIYRMLIRYYESRENYGRAEDSLYNALEMETAERRRVIEEGMRFYERLQALGDERLILGGLPREEVTEGMAALRSLDEREQSQ